MLESFGDRHYDLADVLESRFDAVANRLDQPSSVSPARRQLIGAYFSQEYAVEAAALFNPSMVEHPDQTDLPSGSVRFVMSVRAVGEGHVSSIGFRTGTVDGAGDVRFDQPGRRSALQRSIPTTFSRVVFARQHAELGGDQTSAAFVLDQLPAAFTRADLDLALTALRDQRLTRGAVDRTIDRLERIAASNYAITFSPESRLDERIILPTGPSESNGLEDIRFTRYVDEDGTVDYRGIYTAFDGTAIVPQLLTTEDFRTFEASQLSGPAAKNKGMALFPHRVGGRDLALSRWDRENNSIASSPDQVHWGDARTIQEPLQPWEIVQLGNCGPPVETDAGWLVLTHGVGPVREYSIGALLLDLDDPYRVLGRTTEPLLVPTADERDGYVPNVVYSCGAMRHGDVLVLPYGCSDSSIRVAIIDVPTLVDGMLEGSL